MQVTEPSSLPQYLSRFTADFPFGSDVLKLLRAAGARVVWAAPVRGAAPPRSWALHVRLPRHLEEHFGLTRQFLAYCLGTDDLRIQDATRVQSLIRGATDPIEPNFAMVVTDDPRTEEKLHDWAVERSMGLVIVPVHRQVFQSLLQGDEPELALRDLIEQWVSALNLYDERDPVTGERFFGRGTMLRDFERKLAQGRGHVGVFGLRRIGKTSLLLELRERLSKRPDVVPVFIDLEASVGAAHTAHRIAEALAGALAEHGSLSLREARRALSLPDEWDQVEQRTLISRMADSARSLLTAGSLRGKHLVLILDEAEMLLPSAQHPQDYSIDLFRAVRGVSQETQRVSLVLAGVNAMPTESPFLGGVDNPLFGLLSIEYLGPLEHGECDEMIRRVGRRMQVRWDGPGVSVLTAEVGAHPLLARLAASDVVTRFMDRPPLRPTIGNVQAVMAEFHQRRSAIFEQMVQSLRRYYPEELDLLTFIAGGHHEVVSELAEETPSLLNHLVGYGVVDRHSRSVAIPVFERWLQLHQPD